MGQSFETNCEVMLKAIMSRWFQWNTDRMGELKIGLGRQRKSRL
jgi:hypothetical protein